MTAKEYLMQYRRAEQEIDRLLEEKARWETLAEKVTPTPSKAPGRPGSNDRVGMAVAKIIDLEREIDTKVDRLVDFRREIERAVSKMHGPKEREVLLRRYIHGQAWEEIAKEMGTTERHIYRVHETALFSLNVIECQYQPVI